MFQPLNTMVIDVVSLLMPNGFDRTDDAKRCDTLDKIKAHYDATGKVLVWTGASDTSVFGSNEINIWFRAWHDYNHIKYMHPFTLDGELAVMRKQIRQARMYNNGVEPNKLTEFEMICIEKIIQCEIEGQLRYYLDTGRYVEDQYQFTLNYLREGGYSPTRTIH